MILWCLVGMSEATNPEAHRMLISYELVDLKREITRRVKSIPNDEYQLLLEKRYLCFMPWEKIAVDMGYSIQHIYRLHDWALREFPVPQET